MRALSVGDHVLVETHGWRGTRLGVVVKVCSSTGHIRDGAYVKIQARPGEYTPAAEFFYLDEILTDPVRLLATMAGDA